MRILISLLAASSLLMACERQSPPEPRAGENVSSPPHEQTVTPPAVAEAAHQHSDAKSAVTTYDCDNGESILAQYDNEGENTGVTLTLGDKSYTLYSVVTASGARYASEEGLTPEEGIQWLTKGDEGVLTTLILDHTAPPEDNNVLFRCIKQGAGNSSPGA